MTLHVAMPIKWDYETDVLCVGYGGAGAVAAITAHDSGAKVLVIEKMSAGGGNTRVSGGGFLCPTDVEEAFEYIKSLYTLSNSYMDESLVRVFAEESVKNAEWAKSLKPGTEVTVYGSSGYPKLPGASSMNKYHIEGLGKGLTGSAKNLWELLSHAVEEARNIPVMLDTSAQRLVTDADGEVAGVLARSKGKDISIRASRGVILTTGGFENDSKFIRNYVKGYPIYSCGNPGNTGDGIRMAQKVGAELWHMNGVSCILGIKAPDIEAAFPAVISTPRHIYVDKHGERFMNEQALEIHAGLLATDHYDTYATEYPRIPCYLIFDEVARRAGPISALAGAGYAALSHKWSDDNSVEVQKKWIIKGDTLSDLASKIRTMDAAILGKTIARWNEDMKKGEDTLFHRAVKSTEDPSKAAYKEFAAQIWSEPIDTAPFYAIEIYPCLLNTQGGPKRNAKAQVVDPFGEPISRLYSAGELGSMWGIIYQGAGNIGECMVFGRVAGLNAAQEKPHH
ncbi:MAG: FAD-binding protein [Geobacteraceae bacterium]